MKRRVAILFLAWGLLGTGCVGARSIERPDIKPLRHPAAFTFGAEKWAYGALGVGAPNPVARFLGSAPLEHNGAAIYGGGEDASDEEYIREVWSRFLEEHQQFVAAGAPPKYHFEIKELGRAAIVEPVSLTTLSMFQRTQTVVAFTLTVRDAAGAEVHRKLFKLYRATSEESFPARMAHARVDCLAEVLAYVSREDYLAKPTGGVERVLDPAKPFDQSFPETLMLWAERDGDETKNVYDSRAVSLVYLLFFMGEDVRAEDLARMPFGAPVMNRVAVIGQSLKWPLFPPNLTAKPGSVDAAGNITGL